VLGLFYKDFLLMKKALILNALAMIGSSVLMFLPWEKILKANDAVTETINGETMSFIVMPIISYLFIFLVISDLQSNVFSADESKGYSTFVISTPLTAKGQVLSKYYEILFLSFVGVLWGSVCDVISSCVLGTVSNAMGVYVTFFFVQIFLRAIDVPFLIRFGQSYGKTVKLLMVSVVVFLGIVYRLFGKLPSFGADSIFEAVFTWLVSEKNFSTVALGGISLFPYIAFAMFYLSYRISLKLYGKGVENYAA